MIPFNRRHFLKTTALATGTTALWPWSVARADETAESDFSTFSRRRKWVLDTVTADPLAMRNPYWAAQACFLRGKTELGLQVWRTAVSREQHARVRGVELFNYWPAIHGIAQWGHLMTPADTEPIKAILTRFREYKDMRTSNLHTLACVTRYLAGQVFGEKDFAPEAHYRPKDHNAAAGLRALVEQAAREGFGEWASWPYFDKNILPVLSIARLAADPELRQLAQIAFEAGLARNAPYWLHGRWAMPTARSYPDLLGQKPWGGPQLLWLYFGGTPPDVGENLVGAAVMDYTPPAAIAIAAGDRTRPYTVRSRFGQCFQSAYLNRDYGLFSEAQTKVVDRWQCYPTGVVWNDPAPDRHSFLWVTAPMSDAPSDVSPSHPHGIYNQAQSNLQFEDSLLYVFQFSRTTKYPYALGLVPGGHRAFIDDAAKDGRIFLHYSGVLIAISATAPFHWDRAAGLRAPSGKPFPGDSEFRIPVSPLALAIECAHPDEFPGSHPAEKLGVFRERLHARSRIELHGPAGRYTNRRGDVLERDFHGPARINGRPEDFATWPAFTSPWVNQSAPGSLVLNGGGETITYDFDRREIRRP